jgi:biotin synthase
MGGANSIFFGDKLLTTGNPDHDADLELLRDAGLSPLEPDPAEGGHTPHLDPTETASDAAE